MSDNCVRNTDTEIWRQNKDDFYSPSIHITEQGDIGIKVRGSVIVLSAREWHGLKEENEELKKKENAQSRGCPFCKNKQAELHKDKNVDFVLCNFCGARGPCFDGHPEDASAAWETR